MTWISKNWPTVTILVAGIIASYASYVSSNRDGAQKDTIEALGRENKELGKSIKLLSSLNTQISTRIEGLQKETKLIIGENNELTRAIKDLTESSQKIVALIDARTKYAAEENLKSGTIDLKFSSNMPDSHKVRIFVGGMGTGTTLGGLKKGNVPIEVQGQKFMELDVDDQNFLHISMKIYDLAGNIIAEIEDNNWRPNNNFTGKYNYDANGFEVINNQGHVALSVDVTSDSDIRIQGIIPFRRAKTIFVAGHKTTIAVPFESSEISAQLKAKNLTWQDFFESKIKMVNVKQLFKYTGPSWLGVRK